MVILTQTVPCEMPVGRYRQNLGDRHTVAATWAANTQPFGQNSSKNLFFDRGTIYSYGYHFPIARLVERADGAGKPFVLHTTANGSMTTKTKHLTAVHGALTRFNPGAEVFYVYDVKADSDENHLDNYKIYLSVAEARSREFTNTRKSKKKDWLGRDCLAMVREAMKYSRTVGIGAGLDPDTTRLILADWIQEQTGDDQFASVLRQVPTEDPWAAVPARTPGG